MKTSYIFLTEFNEWVGTLYDATPEEFAEYIKEVKQNLRDKGCPEKTEIIIYKVDKESITIKL